LNSTDGGDEGLGQVWRYTPMGESRGELTLLFESPSADVLDAPDNLCVSPKGSLVICEDGDDTQYVRGLNKDGLIFDFALNVLNGSEFCGATFSPDGRTLFVNIQTPGITLAIWGPWERGAF
jgi:secreted PhoX family phosphatase